MEEALQRLYWACRRRLDFPGNIPDEFRGVVTTAAVLEGLGIKVPGLDETGATQGLRKSVQPYETRTQTRSQPSLRVDTSPAQAFAATGHHLPAETSLDALTAAYDRKSSSSTATSFEVATPNAMDVYEQFAMFAQPSMCAQHSRIPSIDSTAHASCYEDAIKPLLQVEPFLDMSSCTAPVCASSTREFCKALQLDMHPEVSTDHLAHFQNDRYTSGTMCDTFLAPWPGSLAATYRSVFSV